jgi:NAD(P)-dependent dehydrogenase (short-subunit alcohol dehydrogenase family)
MNDLDFAMTRVILITGSSGIAAATARLACRHGARVFLVGNREPECRTFCEEFPTAGYAVADVRDEEAIAEAIAQCIARFNRVDSVFNVAGLSARSLGDGPLHECSTEAWTTLMEVHARGTFFVCRSVLQHWMNAKQPGTILNVGSVLARAPESTHFATHAYAASKGAVESLSLAAASYYAPFGIRINVLAPGLVRTPMSARAQADPAIQSFIAKKQPIKGDFVEAEELARISYFLLTPESFPMTGEVIRADAGWAVTG